MNAVLASVTDVFEAELVVDCGVDWVDIKNPAAGALGAAATPVIADIVRQVRGRRPVSATIGDTWVTPDVIPSRVAACAATGVDYVKAGLDARSPDAETRRLVAVAATHHPLIIVCRAELPPTPDDVATLARCGIAGIMLDTADKAGPGLTELHDAAVLARFVDSARAAGILCGLAGRLRRTDIAVLRPLGADYLGFRSALCRDGARTHRIDRTAATAIVETMRRLPDHLTATR
ncbi:MAG: (5-formylfuran-3-yl)methyl phosphate synthase [Gammaproteobacteria bacterium]